MNDGCAGHVGEIMWAKKKNTLPKYCYSGNSFDTWTVDILYGNGRVETVSVFQAKQTKKHGWHVEYRRMNENSRILKTSFVKKSQNGQQKFLVDQKMIQKEQRRLSYLEAQILAKAELKRLEEKYPIL